MNVRPGRLRVSLLGNCCLFGMLVISWTVQGEEPAANTPHVVPHRGLLRHAPENTLASFRACLELRLGFEFDVRRSKDGHLVCVHDTTLDRTTNGHGPVAERTLAELKQLDAGSWFDPAFRAERIPTIDEIFALLAAHPHADVLVTADMKGDDPEIEADVIRLAKKHGVLPRLLFIGRSIEHPEVRRRLRQAAPEAHVAALANRPDEFEAALAEPDADWVYLRYVPTAAEMKKVHAQGKKAFIAGVTTVGGRLPENWRKARDAGIDGILTDYPLELVRGLRHDEW